MASILRLEQVLPEIAEFINGFEDVVKGQVGPLFPEPRHVPVPALGEGLDGGDVDHPVVEVIEKSWHFLGHELPLSLIHI